jgi:alanine racemase
MRLELLAGVNNTTVVNDAYSCDLYSLEIAIDFALANAVKKPVSVFLSDLPQTGIEANELFDQLHQLMVEKGIERWIGVGPQHMQWKGKGDYVYCSFPTTEKLLESLSTDDYQNGCLLIKGARDYRFERVVDCFREQNHETVLEVNLNALTHNLNYFRSQLTSSTRLMVMVKAFGYGSGAHEVSSLLQFNQVDYLAVAYTDEGLSLRNHGISLPIMVMNPEHASLGNMIRHHLEPELFNFRTLRAFIDTLSQHHVVDPYPVHIKLDTGMHRLGFEESDIEELVAELRSAKQLRVASVFTHLSSTDNPAHDAFTKKQLAQFSAWSTRIQEALPYPVLRHALNTGGIQRFPEAQFDMVRLGVGLYGVSATPNEQRMLKSVGYLSTGISQIKNIPAGESIGYNRQFIAPKDMRIATIPLGYADGLRRAVGNGKGYVWINGQAAPTVGNVCMDMTMVDVSLIHCKEGDRVELFGEHISLLQLAKWCDTIPYEILTSISQRVRRVYSQE